MPPIRGALGLLLACLALPAWAGDNRVLPSSERQIELSFAPVVRRVAPAVVNIYTRAAGQSAGPSPVQVPADLPSNGEVTPEEDRSQSSLGSGVIVDPNGTIITNWHVIRGAGQITVVLSDRREFQARITRTDERADLAVLRIVTGGEALPYLEIRDSDELEVGDLVLAVGNPFGVGQTVTSGIVSAIARTVPGISDYRTYIQTDAAINPGNSGGALVSLDGKLIGINTALYSEGNGSVGIGFAIPTALVRSVLAHAEAGGSVVRPWLGASGRSVTQALARRLGLRRPEGMLVESVVPGSPVDHAGLQPGDAVLSVNGRVVEDRDALHYRFATLPVGASAQFGIWRAGKMQVLDVHLAPPPEDPPRGVTALGADSPLAGATVANLSPALADELQIDAVRGVIILDVRRRSAAARLRLAVEDIIDAAGNMPVSTVAALQAVLAAAKAPLHLRVHRRDRALTVTILHNGA